MATELRLGSAATFESCLYLQRVPPSALQHPLLSQQLHFGRPEEEIAASESVVACLGFLLSQVQGREEDLMLFFGLPDLLP